MFKPFSAPDTYAYFLLVAILWPGLWGSDRLQAGIVHLLPAAGTEITDTASPEHAPAHTVLAQGVLLIAGKKLLDPNFTRSVILITEYDERGTMGLVLNRRTKISVDQALPEIADYAEHLGAIHIGGPVAANHIRLLVKTDDVPRGARQIVDDIFVVDSMDTLKQLESAGAVDNAIRVYMGFAGWAPGQLETELLRGDWYIWPASSNIIFSETPENIWYELIYQATAKWI